MMIREAREADLPELGRMGASLVRQHHGFDTDRFFLIDRGLEEGYAEWLGKERARSEAVVLVAEKDGRPVGYAYGTVEPRNWNLLRDRCGMLHDLWVDAPHRNDGAGRALAEAVIAKFGALGVPRIVLMSASRNEGAQRFFQHLGWRSTMVEMTREL